MKRAQFLTVTLLFAATTAIGQAPPPAPAQESPGAKARGEANRGDLDTTYGRIKELTLGQKVVVDIDNAPDKTFDLTDKDLKVNLAKGLKVGDTVKVTEREVAGKTQSVTIAKHSGGGVTHGDKDPAAKKP